jgi:hypothetical protein
MADKSTRDINVNAFCGYCTSAVIIFFLYIPAVIFLTVYTAETQDIGNVIITICLVLTFVGLHALLPIVCCFTELPDTTCKIAGYLAIQMAVLVWYCVGFGYIASKIADDESITDNLKTLGIISLIVIAVTAIGILSVPIIVFVNASIFNLVCHGPCKALHKTWRLRKAVKHYTEVNNYQSTTML